MNEILENLFRHPLMITLLSVILGTGVLSYFNYRRTRRDHIRDKSLEFLDTISGELNSALGRIPYLIRKSHKGKDDILDKNVEVIFKSRLSVRIKSQAYLDNVSFAKAHGELVWQIRNISKFFESLKKDFDKNILIFVTNHYNQLSKVWNIDFEEEPEDLKEPYLTLMKYYTLIWHRTFYLFSDSTSYVLGKKKKTNYSVSSANWRIKGLE